MAHSGVFTLQQVVMQQLHVTEHIHVQNVVLMMAFECKTKIELNKKRKVFKVGFIRETEIMQNSKMM